GLRVGLHRRLVRAGDRASHRGAHQHRVLAPEGGATGVRAGGERTSRDGGGIVRAPHAVQGKERSMNTPDPQFDDLILALREDLPSDAEQERTRARLTAAGVTLGSALVAHHLATQAASLPSTTL